MTERQRELAFLRQIIAFDDTDERRKLEERIAQVERDERCVLRAVSLIALFNVLSVAVLGYGMILQENFPYTNKSRFAFELTGALGLASLICLVVLVGLLTTYRWKLNRLREECRRLITKLLESRLPRPHPTPLPAGARSASAIAPLPGI